MLHQEKNGINNFGWDRSFCIEKKENGAIGWY